MACAAVWLLPVWGFISGVLTLFVPYIVAGARNDTDWAWPFISDGGALPPESCIFGQLLNITAVLFALCMYLRHVQIVTFYEKTVNKDGRFWRALSLIMLVMGLVACFFVSMVANFQETSVLWVHSTSALLAFGLGLIYIWCQTLYTYVMRPRMHGIWLCHARLIIGIIALYSFLQMQCGWRIFDPIYGTVNPAKPLPSRWTRGEDGYLGHILTTTGEWGLVLFFFAYLLSFAWEMRHSRLHLPKMLFKDAYLFKWRDTAVQLEGVVVINESFHFREPQDYGSRHTNNRESYKQTVATTVSSIELPSTGAKIVDDKSVSSFVQSQPLPEGGHANRAMVQSVDDSDCEQQI